MLCKLDDHRASYFADNWHRLDFVLAWLSTVDVWIVALLVKGDGGDGNDSGLKKLSILRLLRLLRVARLVRLVKALKELWLLGHGLIQAARTHGLEVYISSLLMTVRR